MRIKVLAEYVKTSTSVSMLIYFVEKRQHALMLRVVIIVNVNPVGMNTILNVIILTNVIWRHILVIRSENQFRFM